MPSLPGFGPRVLSLLRTSVLIGLLAGILAPRAKAEDAGAKGLPEVRAQMQAFVDRGDLAGAVTVVGRAEGPARIDVVGSRNLEGNAPMTADTLFRIASMTKPITAMGVMILAEEGKLTVDDPVQKHLPEFKGQMLVAERGKDTLSLKRPPRPITLRDLMTHTSGLPGQPPEGLRDLYAKRNHTLAEGVIAYSQMPLDFEPGSKWSYCNPGIDTLGRVIEVVSGESYEAFLKRRVFDPLGMTDTTFYPTKEQLARLAQTYDRKGGKLVPMANAIVGPPKDARYPVPAGGLYSTAPDLAKLYQAVLNGGAVNGKRILSAESLKEMTRVHTGDLKTGFTEGNGWGLGWCVVRKPTGVTAMLSPGTFGHGGAFGTQAWIDPSQDLFLVLLIQRVGLPNSDGSPMRKEFQEAAVAAMKK